MLSMLLSKHSATVHINHSYLCFFSSLPVKHSNLQTTVQCNAYNYSYVSVKREFQVLSIIAKQ